MRRKAILAAVIGLVLTNAYAVHASEMPKVNADTNAGTQMNRLNEYMERERIAKEIQENKAGKTAKIEGVQGTDAPAVPEVKFNLKGIVTDPSSVLTSEELANITEAYVGKEASVSDLYKVVERINALYQAKGYLTCRAFLLQQTIEQGIVKITLIEGKTGDVQIQNNKWTKANYIKKRIDFAKGEVTNVSELNKDLLRFNATNDAQLRIIMQAGKESGTTDFVITAFEPKQYNVNLFVDNAGNKNNGELREGLFFTAKSVSGSRDALTIGGVNSRGTKAVSSSYNHSLGRSGTKLNIGYSTNSVKTVKGAYKNQVKGHSNAVNIGLTQPWVTTQNLRSEAILELQHQNSSTDFRDKGSSTKLVDDTINDAYLGFAMTNYGTSHVIYQRHGFLLGKSDSDIFNNTESYALFKSSGFYQKAYEHGQSISARGDFQWSNKDNVPSARQFYIGGMNTVRGYDENFRGADKGINLSIEYAVSLNQKRTVSAFTFLDYGQLFGEDAESSNYNNALFSTGLGVKANIGKNIYANLTLGVPLKKHLDDGHKEPSDAKLHFLISGQI